MTGSATSSVATIADLRALVGREVGTSSWTRVDQDAIDAFARLTGDDQWIHVDVERAARESPFGSTIAHGFLVLSLSPRLTFEVFRIDANDVPGGIRFGVNYGLDRVRFVSPLPSGERVRARVAVLELDERPDGAQFTLRLTFEREGGDRPVAVADWIQRVYT